MHGIRIAVVAVGIALLTRSESQAQSVGIHYTVEVQVVPNNLTNVFDPKNGWRTIWNTTSLTSAQNAVAFLEFLQDNNPSQFNLAIGGVPRGYHVEDIRYRAWFFYYSAPAIYRIPR